ncbi:MAG: response regulator receiver protein [Pedosphaera sp.]|nr:response regulator receiver protein [Pedosphaera sp.]
MPKAKYTVLLADDSEDDRLFMRRALLRTTRLVMIGEVCDGEEAIDYLSGVGAYSDREKFPLPDVLLLDLKMPRKTGYEVLEWLQTQSLDGLVVVVVSGSFLPEDITRSLALGADAYQQKVALKDEQEGMVREIENLLDKS